ncbi:hypothetical protein B0O99DRAFT_691248 [Bisporella sp. PMI_857]|nr:hypothetical protein B0O99DRAFT_691248 [Bisporella sp. PMI_857]
MLQEPLPYSSLLPHSPPAAAPSHTSLPPSSTLSEPTPPKQPALKTRRPHNKSRAGCSECKRRHTRCGEQRPRCDGCVRRRIPCIYPIGKPRNEYQPVPQSTGPKSGNYSAMLQALQNGTTSMSPTAQTDLSPTNLATHDRLSPSPWKAHNGENSHPPPTCISTSLPLQLPPFGGGRIGSFDMEDMAYWHQFITQTAETISMPWKDELPRLALTCDYLMHGILATGAIHLAFLDTSQKQKYELRANEHTDLALKPFQLATSKITSQNCNQVFGFSTLLMVLNYASYRGPEHLLPFSGSVGYGGLSNWIVCLRGCTLIYQQAKAQIAAGPLGFLVSQQSLEGIEKAGEADHEPDDAEKSLNLVKDLLKSTKVKARMTVAEIEDCTDAVDRLQKLLIAASQTNDLVTKKMIASMWPSIISETFLELVSEQQTTSLIIMAHYCLLLKQCESYWYMSHRAQDMFEAIRGSRHRSQWFMQPEFYPYIAHPLKIFSSGTQNGIQNGIQMDSLVGAST